MRTNRAEGVIASVTVRIEAWNGWRIGMLDIKQLGVQYVTDQTGAKTGIIMPIAEFEELMEDIEDLAAVAERREEPTVSHEDLLVELKRDGLI